MGLKKRSAGWKVGFLDDISCDSAGCVLKWRRDLYDLLWLAHFHTHTHTHTHTLWPVQKQSFFHSVGLLSCAVVCVCDFSQGWARTRLHLNLGWLKCQDMDLHVSNPTVRDKTLQQMKTKDINVADQHCDQVNVSPGDFNGWTTSTEVLPYDTSGIPAGAVVCQLPRFRCVSLVITRFSYSWLQQDHQRDYSSIYDSIRID